MSERGRPLKDDARRNQYRLRMTDEETGMLEYLSEETDETKSDVLRKALKIYYNLKTHKH